MGLGAGAGRWLTVGAVVAGLGVACGGHSERTEGDDSSAGQPSVGTGGSRGGSGAAPSGGNAGTGISLGGSAGTSTGVGGAAGTGISVGGYGGTEPMTTCPICPDLDFHMTVRGDGEPYAIAYNGFVATAQDIAVPVCPDRPLRGTVGGCGQTTLYVSGCEDPMSGPPCLAVNGPSVSYVDRQTGRLWSGSVTSVTPTTASAGVATGTMTIELLWSMGNDGGADRLELSVDYLFCTSLSSPAYVPC